MILQIKSLIDYLPFIFIHFLITLVLQYYSSQKIMKVEQPKTLSKSKTQKSIKTQQQKQPSVWQLMINGIVRPPRAKYSTVQLGNKVVNYRDKLYLRDDIKIQHQGKELELTIYIAAAKNKYPIPFVILYMHGNSSCKLEALGLMKNIPQGISLASFDFMGCGKNQEMDTITLGYRQAQQSKTVMQYLQYNMGLRVILWGRSMGAATALLNGQAEFIVADSSFKSFESLCKQVAKQHSPTVVPNCMINCFFPCVFTKIKKDINKKAQYNVQDLDVKEAVKKLNPDTVVVFMSGDHDQLINKRNSQKLYNNCPCKEKYLKIFEGDHNSKRPQTVLTEVMDIIQNYVKKQQPSLQTSYPGGPIPQ